MPRYRDVPRVRSRDDEWPFVRLVPDPEHRSRFRVGFWAEPPRADERLTAAISVRPGDPDLPVFDRRPDLSLPDYLQPPVMVVRRYQTLDLTSSRFAIRDEDGHCWVVRVGFRCPERLPLMLEEQVSRTGIVAGPFRSMTRAVRWHATGEPDDTPLRTPLWRPKGEKP